MKSPQRVLPPRATWARAIAASIALGFDDTAAARLGGVAGDDARRVLAGWGALSRSARATAIATAVAALRSPLPPGWEHVHRDWIEHGLAWDPDAAVAWADPAAGVHDPVTAWRLRGTTARWVALPPPEDVVAIAMPGDLARAPRDAIVAWLARCGLFAHAHLALHAGLEDVARLAAATPAGRDLLAIARQLLDDPATRAELGSARQLAALDLEAAPAITGARIAAPHLIDAGGDLAWHVALRLPRAIGAPIVEGDGIDGIAWSVLVRLGVPAP
jgi:hypothetical protein